MPSTLHPYLHSALRASRSSHDIAAHPITQESYSLHSLSVQHLPGTNPPPATISVPPSPNLGIGYLPSTNSSVVDIHLPTPATRSPNASPRSSQVFGDVAQSAVALLSEAHPHILPGIPETIGRYDQKSPVINEPTKFTIPPLTISLLPNPPPTGWITCLHPEGAQYFFHPKKRVFTDANLFDPASLSLMEDNIQTIRDFLRAHGVQLAPDVDLVLDECPDLLPDQSKACRYYFVNHSDRCVFWMDKAESEMFPVMYGLNGVTSASHIRHELEAQYWSHCEMFPRSLRVTHDMIDELRDIVLHSLGDLTTSPTSTVSHTVDQLNNMLRVIDGIGNTVGKDTNKLSGSSCMLGRFMNILVRGRVYNFHGEPNARLDVHQSMYGDSINRTPLVTVLSPLLFYAPDFHLLGLCKIYTDGLIRYRGWAEFISKLNHEWQEFTLYATVVLNANVAFLSIQSVDTDGTSQPNRTPAQISSYLSMLTSIGAVLIGLLLVKQHRDWAHETAENASRFIFSRTHPTLGLETLAILYSLPYAMLIWSMVSFLAAFSFMCFEKSSLVTRTLVGALWAVVGALILWCAFAAWESADWDWLRRVFAWRSPAPEVEAASTKAASVKSDSEAGLGRNTWRRRWASRWPSLALPLRKTSYDSERTVTDGGVAPLGRRQAV